MRRVLSLLLLLHVGFFAYAKDHNNGVSLYTGIGGATLDDEGVVSFDIKLVYSPLSWLSIGVQGSAYHTLEREYEDSTGRAYQAESGLLSLFVHPHWAISDKIDLGIKIASGMQLIQLRYMGDLRDSMVHYEEYPDKLYVPFTDLGLTLEYQFCEKHSLQMEMGYRNCHPTKSPYLENDVDGTFYASILYGIVLF